VYGAAVRSNLPAVRDCRREGKNKIIRYRSINLRENVSAAALISPNDFYTVRVRLRLLHRRPPSEQRPASRHGRLRAHAFVFARLRRSRGGLPKPGTHAARNASRTGCTVVPLQYINQRTVYLHTFV